MRKHIPWKVEAKSETKMESDVNISLFPVSFHGKAYILSFKSKDFFSILKLSLGLRLVWPANPTTVASCAAVLDPDTATGGAAVLDADAAALPSPAPEAETAAEATMPIKVCMNACACVPACVLARLRVQAHMCVRVWVCGCVCVRVCVF